MTDPIAEGQPRTDREVAIAAARAGAVVVGEALGRAVEPEMKGSVNPVTEVDMAAERAVLAVIDALRPGDAILSEEQGGLTEPVGRRWIVDPLDGTVNFVHGIPQVSVSVGLWDGLVPVAGAVVDVARREVFSAARGEGAHLGDEPIRVSSRTRLSECVIATGFPYDRDVHAAAYTAAMGQVMARTRDVRRLGSAALDFAWVACGRVDGFWEYGLWPWDVAAGLLLVQEAGGLSADLLSEPATVESSDFILAAPGIAEQLIDLIRSVAPPHVRAAG
ncbi:MAG: inositol monophosphatase family protein [bacterium]|nr:inositol monophosphatase family protein [bacterium]MDE0290767.1 inositol monophosphatase family protein [bacterium]MDE0440071.1 inositol monophosphatase family protein [bacterium]